MGWNTWNTFACEIDEILIKDTADIMISEGLVELGYNYLNLDDCWMSHDRTVNGTYQADHIKFPSGMGALGDFLHDNGLKYGIYTSAGTYTCQGYPGSLGYEEIDAQTFADWGVDYLKYDNCHNEGISSVERYTKMRDALAQTGRPIFYSLCQWGEEDSWEWAAAVSNAWRTTGDIGASWKRIVQIFWKTIQWDVPRSGPGAWADPDMLEVGNGHLTLDEQKTHFALWVIIKAPLLLGMDLRSISQETLEVIKNKRLIELHQDVRFPAASCVVGCSLPSSWFSLDKYASIFTSSHANDTIAMVVNWSQRSSMKVGFQLSEVGIVPTPEQGVLVTNVWTGEVLDTYVFGDTIHTPPLPSHGNIIYRLSIVDSLPHRARQHEIPNQTTILNPTADSRLLTIASSASFMSVFFVFFCLDFVRRRCLRMHPNPIAS